MILDGKYLLLKRNQYHQIFPMLYKMGYVWPTHFLDYDLSGIDFLYKRFGDYKLKRNCQFLLLVS